MWTCGYAQHGQLGTGYLGDPDKEAAADAVVLPVNVLVPGAVRAVACGEQHSVAITDDGEVYSTGANDFGQLGLGQKKPVGSFTRITGLFPKKARAVACGNMHTAVLCETGEVFTWGRGEWDQLGNSNKDLYAPKVSPSSLSLRLVRLSASQIVENISQLNVVKISAGTVNTVALLASGTHISALCCTKSKCRRGVDLWQQQVWSARSCLRRTAAHGVAVPHAQTHSRFESCIHIIASSSPSSLPHRSPPRCSVPRHGRVSGRLPHPGTD